MNQDDEERQYARLIKAELDVMLRRELQAAGERIMERIEKLFEDERRQREKLERRVDDQGQEIRKLEDQSNALLGSWRTLNWLASVALGVAGLALTAAGILFAAR